MSKKTFRTEYSREDGQPCVLKAEVRFDDECKNGHSTFAITGELYGPECCLGEPRTKSKSGFLLWMNSCGCLHGEIAEHLPDLQPYLKWHLFSTDGPMHYISNARYWAGHLGYTDGKASSPPNWTHFKCTVAWGVLPEWDTGDPQERFANAPDALQQWLHSRFVDLMGEFRQAVESLGFVYEQERAADLSATERR